MDFFWKLKTGRLRRLFGHLRAELFSHLPRRVGLKRGQAWAKVHSTRQRGFNMLRGRRTGIAARAEGYVFSGSNHNLSTLTPRAPKSVFFHGDLDPSLMLTMLRQLANVKRRSLDVVIASSDRTFPRQIDDRYPPNSGHEYAAALALAEEPYVRSLWVENLDEEIPGARAMPGGIWPRGQYDSLVRKIQFSDFPKAHPKKLLLCAHRTRAGSQFDLRRRVNALARSNWSSFTTVIEEAEMPSETYMSLLRDHSFTLCVRGGGIDPNPKAFEALLSGSIPVIESSPVAAAYSDLPIVVVDSWSPHSLSREFLIRELRRIEREYDFWPAVLEGISLNTWNQRIFRV